MPSVGHYVFKCSAVLNQIRILTPDPLSSVPFFCSPGWQPKLLRSCHFVDAASAGAIGFRAISNSEEFRVRDKVRFTALHYGQLVVYYRANNMVPPASR
jgi:hypothetical protein